MMGTDLLGRGTEESTRQVRSSPFQTMSCQSRNTRINFALSLYNYPRTWLISSGRGNARYRCLDHFCRNASCPRALRSVLSRVKYLGRWWASLKGK